MRFLHLSLALAAAGLLLGLPTASQAATIASGTYFANNHPDGNARPPGYGLRLDGLEDGDANTIYTFDFEAPGAAMFLTYDSSAARIRIFGTAFGGEDDGTQHLNPAFYDIDFTYVGVTMEGDTLVSDQGRGSITKQGGATTFMHAYAGKHDHAFYLGPNHRGFVGDSGRGWLKYAGNREYMQSSDWLFTLGPAVPEPSGALIFGAGLLVAAGSARRRRL